MRGCTDAFDAPTRQPGPVSTSKAKAPVEPVVPEQVRRWRLELLEQAGYPPDEALALSGRSDVDVRFAARLLREGCSVQTALRILL